MDDANDFMETYKLLGNDALSWLEQATFLKMSADVIWTSLEAALAHPPVNPGVREQQLAFSQSFMMLTGFAFENLVKGIIVARNRNAVETNKVLGSEWKNDRGGHGLSTLAPRYVSLSSDELDLLQRLEEYIVWAGRYSIPNNSTTFIKAHEPESRQTIKPSTDRQLIDGLFTRLCQTLREDRAATPSKSEVL